MQVEPPVLYHRLDLFAARQTSITAPYPWYAARAPEAPTALLASYGR